VMAFTTGVMAFTTGVMKVTLQAKEINSIILTI
jgi:hypothetical protein